MSRFIDGNKVLHLLDIEPFEIVHLAKEGNLQPFTQHGKRVCDIQKKREYENSDACKLYYLKLELGGIRAGKVRGSKTQMSQRLVFEEKEIKMKIAALEGKSIVPLSSKEVLPSEYRDCIWCNFDLPQDAEQAEKIIAKFMNYKYLKADVEKLVPDNSPTSEASFDATPAPTESCDEKKTKTPKHTCVKTPPGTKWQEIRIDIVHEGLIKITHPQGEITTTRDGLGLGGKKKISWEEFEEFAANKGYYDFGPGVNRDKLKNKKYRLKKILQKLFPNVEGDPIVYHKREYDEDRKMRFEEKYQSALIITKIDVDLEKTISDEEEIDQEFRDYGNSESIW